MLIDAGRVDAGEPTGVGGLPRGALRASNALTLHGLKIWSDNL
jgi:hypothetical protein